MIQGVSSNPQILCERYNHINLEDLKGADGCVHQPTFKALVDSASSCMLCKLITEACVHYLQRERANVNVETGHKGPVRLFATEQNGTSSGMELRPLAVLQESQLSQNVLVTVGKLPQKLPVNSSWSILLEMYALKGRSLQRRLLASIHFI